MKFITSVSAVAVLLVAACGQLTTPNQINPPPVRDETYAYNRSFITVEETTQLYYGMTPQSVTALCGKPLCVGYGSRDRIIWIYQVRELGVGSLARDNKPVKTSDITQIWDPLHFFGLTFENNSLSYWAPVSGSFLLDGAIFGDLLSIEEEQEGD